MERWLPIPGYVGHYSISTDGRVRSEARLVPHALYGQKPIRERVLARKTNKRTGYLYVELCLNGAQRSHAVHQLVARTFIGPPPDGMEVAHADGDRTNAHLSNLRYATHTENQADARRHGTVARGARLPQSKLSVSAVAAIRSDPRFARVLAAELGVSESQVCRVRRGEAWAHVG